MTLEELTAQLAELDTKRAAVAQQIATLQAAERGGAIARITQLMTTHGIAATDLVTKAKPVAKVAAKYRDPATGETWSGRGLQPKWLKARLAEGKALEEFAL